MKSISPPRLAFRQLYCFAAALLLAAAAQAGGVPNILNAVALTQGNNDSQVIKLVFKESVEELPIAFTTSNPQRLVLDFPATGSALPRTSETADGGAVKNWQVVQAGERTRVVLNLNLPVSYELRRDRNLVLAVIHGIDVQPGTPLPARFAETDPAGGHSIRDIDFRRGKEGESRILVSLSGPGVGVDIQKLGGAIQVDFLNTSLPSPLRRRLDVTDFATPAQTVETFEQGKQTRMLVSPKGKWDYSAWQAGDLFTLEVRSLEGPQSAQDGKPQYIGEKLSLNFQNVEVRSVLQVIADFTGFNIITSDTVSGSVTLRLKDVPWDQALDIILRAKGLAKRATGRTLYILDEPTTGLHFHDISKLIGVLQALVDRGNSVLVIEHNMEVIKVADYIIDLGPEGGERGGIILAQGTPEQVARHKTSFTALYLKDILGP